MDERMRMIEAEMAKFENEIRTPMPRPPPPARPAMALQFLPHAMMRTITGGPGQFPPPPPPPGMFPPMNMYPPPHMLRSQHFQSSGSRGPPPLAPLPPRPIGSLSGGPNVLSGSIIEGAPTKYGGKPASEIAVPVPKKKAEPPAPPKSEVKFTPVEKPGTSKLQAPVLPADLLEADRRAHQFAEAAALHKQQQTANKKPKRFIRTAGGETWEDPSLADWDPNDFRIFCGDLGNEVSDELLGKAFRKYSSFQKAKVVRDKRTNKSKGFGFISFKDPQDFTRAIKEMDGKYVGNRPIKLRKSEWKDRSFNVVVKKSKKKAKIGLRY